MSFLAAFGKPGVGILPLQDFSFKKLGAPAHNRALVAATRILDRRADGTFIDDATCRGDLARFFPWKTKRATYARSVTSWQEVMPCITISEAQAITPGGGNIVQDGEGSEFGIHYEDPGPGGGTGGGGGGTGSDPVKKTQIDLNGGFVYGDHYIVPSNGDPSDKPPGLSGGYYSVLFGGWVFDKSVIHNLPLKDDDSSHAKATKKKGHGPDTTVQPEMAGFSDTKHPAGSSVGEQGQKGGDVENIQLGVIDSNDSFFGKYSWPKFEGAGKDGNYWPRDDSGGGWGQLGSKPKPTDPNKPPTKGGGSQNNQGGRP